MGPGLWSRGENMRFRLEVQGVGKRLGLRDEKMAFWGDASCQVVYLQRNNRVRFEATPNPKST